MRGAAVLVLGLWMGLLVASWAVATASFRTVDRVLGPGAAPELQGRLAPLAPDVRRAVLRHVASESNRWMFGAMSIAELALGLALVALSWRLGPVPRALALAALLVVVLQSAALGPAILRLGRSIDFVPRPLPPAEGRRFGLLHAAYMLADLVKAAVLSVAAWVIVWRGP